MSWLVKTLGSSLGRKLLMALTGLFLCSFLVVHCGLNALIFANDGGKLFNEGAEFMAHNFLIRTMEIVLFLGLIVHAFDALVITLHNRKARPIGYMVTDGKANSKWYSRSMGLLGTLILMFLIIHLKHFWVVSRFTDEITSGEETLFGEMKEVFENPFVVLLYVLSMFSLAYHLLHGFQSGFQTLGINHPKYTPFIKFLGVVFSVIVPFVFALMPLAIHFKFIQ
jgi:succinate dehydrogenase / fumarate reductase cytochrome b subunit